MEAWQWSVAASDCQRQRTLPIICQLEQHRSLTPLANWWEVHLSRPEEPWGGEMTEARPNPHTGAVQLYGRPPKSQCTTVSGGGSPLPPQTGGHRTLMDTSLQVRLWAASIGAEATEEVGRGNGWCL